MIRNSTLDGGQNVEVTLGASGYDQCVGLVGVVTESSGCDQWVLDTAYSYNCMRMRNLCVFGKEKMITYACTILVHTQVTFSSKHCVSRVVSWPFCLLCLTCIERLHLLTASRYLQA